MFVLKENSGFVVSNLEQRIIESTETTDIETDQTMTHPSVMQYFLLISLRKTIVNEV